MPLTFDESLAVFLPKGEAETDEVEVVWEAGDTRPWASKALIIKSFAASGTTPLDQ